MRASPDRDRLLRAKVPIPQGDVIAFPVVRYEISEAGIAFCREPGFGAPRDELFERLRAEKPLEPTCLRDRP